MFKGHNEDWNIWEEQYDEPVEESSSKKIFPKKKKKLGKRRTNTQNLDNVDYLNEDSGNIYSKEASQKYSGAKICVAIFLFVTIALGVIGYVNTDFDEYNQGYIVNYDIHYERQYVDMSDELFEYCKELREELKTIMPELSTNSLSTTNVVNKMKETLKAKTNKVSRYTEVPEIMATYNDTLINFSLSSQKMMDNMLSYYQKADYMDWAESAYADFSSTFQSIEYLRTQINSIIYRNVYGGENNG